jgi:glycosyltransferase involved in cell wall biosynthesis
MADGIAVSIIICTRNRAAALRETLAALGRTARPPDLAAELLVVDNASTDGTRELVRPPALYLHEPQPGVARARNTGLAAARGDVLLFLDDDTRPPAEWLEPMCRPILAGRADAVAGGVALAPHLRRPWMRPLHLTWLAATDYIDPAAPQEMVSANMALGRRVLARVPGFDPALGPGALGQGEDALFSWQLLRAGFRIAGALETRVEHHFEPARLSRASFRETARRRGRTLAYQRHHWEHLELPDARRRVWRRRARLALLRVRAFRECLPREGMPEWEMRAIEDIAFLRHWEVERVHPRRYERYGLAPLSG